MQSRTRISMNDSRHHHAHVGLLSSRIRDHKSASKVTVRKSNKDRRDKALLTTTTTTRRNWNGREKNSNSTRISNLPLQVYASDDSRDCSSSDIDRITVSCQEMPVNRRAPLQVWNGRNSYSSSTSNSTSTPSCLEKRGATQVLHQSHSQSPMSICPSPFEEQDDSTDTFQFPDSSDHEDLPQFELAMQAFLKRPSFDWQKSDSSMGDSPTRLSLEFDSSAILQDESHDCIDTSMHLSSPDSWTKSLELNGSPLLVIKSPYTLDSMIQDPALFPSTSKSCTDNDSLSFKVWDLDDSPTLKAAAGRAQNRRHVPPPNFADGNENNESSSIGTRNSSLLSLDTSPISTFCQKKSPHRKTSPRISHQGSSGASARRKSLVPINGHRQQPCTNHHVDAPPHCSRVSTLHSYVDPAFNNNFLPVSVKSRVATKLPSLSEKNDIVPNWPNEWKRLEAENQRLRNRLAKEDRFVSFREVFDENRRLRDRVAQLEAENNQVKVMVQDVKTQMIATQAILQRNKQLEAELAAYRQNET